MPRLRPFLFAGAGLLLALVVACGGDDDSSSSSGSGNADSGASSGNQLQAVSLSESAAKLSDLESFRFDMTLKFDLGDLGSGEGGEGDDFAAAMLALLGNIDLEGAFVAPDRSQIKTTFFGQDVEFIQIGDEAWQNDGSGWQPAEAEDMMFSVGDDPTAMFSDFLPQAALDVAETKSETVNGVKTTRYSFDKESLLEAAQAMGETEAGFEDLDSAELSIWLTDEGVPIKILADITGTDETGQELSIHLEVNVYDINSDDIKIESPI